MAKRKIDYRKIWKAEFGNIPKDENGISCEIHHIDGNRDNNDISNLICVSIQEHYNIHFNNEDYYACACINKRMNMTEEDRKILSEKIAEANRNRPNPFNDPEIQKRIQKTKKDNYIKENHQFYGKKRPEHSEYMKSIGWGKNRSKEHQENLTASLKKSAEKKLKEYIVVLPNAEEIIIKGLNKFCAENGLNVSGAHRVLNGIQKSYKNYIFKRVNYEHD